ncbi:MAG: hypothetical protein IKN12_11005, partial [Selenomonadaceae bacterium]|nr:hypothetical protein [Selenomonadaceae bacterium]
MGIAVERNLDMMFGEKDLEDVCAFKQFPIYMGVTMQPPKDDIFEDMRWTISKGSGMVQLRKIIP